MKAQPREPRSEIFQVFWRLEEIGFFLGYSISQPSVTWLRHVLLRDLPELKIKCGSPDSCIFLVGPELQWGNHDFYSESPLKPQCHSTARKASDKCFSGRFSSFGPAVPESPPANISVCSFCCRCFIILPLLLASGSTQRPRVLRLVMLNSGYLFKAATQMEALRNGFSF